MFRSSLRGLSAVVKVGMGGAVLFTAEAIMGGPYLLCESSMEPTLRSGQWVWATHRCNMWGGYVVKKGDIIIARHPEDPKKRLCKRIKATSGECVSSQSVTSFSTSVEVVPQGHVWLEGDNRADSVDSRVWGPLPIGLIEGKVVFTAAPWASLK